MGGAVIAKNINRSRMNFLSSADRIILPLKNNLRDKITKKIAGGLKKQKSVMVWD